MQRVPPEDTERSRALRREMTPQERAVWLALRGFKPRFTRQSSIDRFTVDLVCRSLRIAIEIDGSQHADSIEEDAARTAFLEARGWRVLRFWNNDVDGNLAGVVEVILAEVARGPTHPRLLPSREGS